MKIEHSAVPAKSEKESDKFFIELLGLKKTRSFTVDKTLSDKLFGVPKDIKVIRYANEQVDIEVIIDEINDSGKKNPFTHLCFSIENRDRFVEKAKTLGYELIKVPRKDKGYYLFIKDEFSNPYERK